MINTLQIKKRDSHLPMITKEIGGMMYAKPLFDSKSNVNILPRTVFDYDGVGKFKSFFEE